MRLSPRAWANANSHGFLTLFRIVPAGYFALAIDIQVARYALVALIALLSHQPAIIGTRKA